MRRLDDVQVAIVGSGPIGLTLANLLGQAGISVALIERNAGTVTEPRAVSIDDESLRTLQAAGLIETVMASIVPGYGSHYLSPSGRCFARVEPTGTPYGYPRRNAFRQPVLEAQLRAGLDRFSHVRQLYATTLEGFSQTGAGVSLALRDAGGAALGLEAVYLVGCDGASSTVRGLLGATLGGTTFDERWLILDLENNDNTTRHTEVFCNPRRPCITLPGPDRTRRYEFKLLAGETDAQMLNDHVVADLLSTHGASPGHTLRRKVVYRFHARVADRWRQGRVFLAGDAAHLTPPFAGQGMNSGLRDATNLAWKLAFCLQPQTPAGLAEALLASYQQEREDHIWQMIRLALRMGRVMAPRSALDGALIRLLFDALRIWPPARDYVSQMRYKPKPGFNQGWLVADGRGRASLVGRMLPQPRVVTPRGDMLLDSWIGPGFALLARGRGAASRLAELRHPLWAQLGAVRVALDDGPSAQTRDAGFKAAMAPYLEGVLLVRPDRYVAACITLGDEDRIVAALTSG